MSIAVNITKEQDWEWIEYIGPINEESEVHLAKIAANLGPKVRIKLDQVTMVNSCGVRSWVNFMRDIESGRTIEFHRCTSEIVMQINMIPSFKGNATIYSVFGTYTCDNCGSHKNILFEKNKNLPDSESEDIPPPACDGCGEEMEMEEIEEEFFAFVAA